MIVLNAIEGSTNIASDIKKVLSKYSIPLAKTDTKHRIAYNKSFLNNSLEGDDKARQGISDLVQEIINKLKQDRI